MIEKNKRYIIEITDISSDGNGVGAVDGFVVFVPMTAVGDIAEVLIVKVLSGYAIGRLMALQASSEDRCEPVCPVYKRCGGCHLQHIKYDAQLAVKRGFIETAMRRLGGFKNFSCDEMLGMDDPYRYRNKCIFPIGRNEQGENVSGFYARRSHDIIEISDCAAGSKVNAAITRAVLAYMKEVHAKPYDEKRHCGLIRRVFIRSARSSGEIMVVLSVNGDNIPKRERLIKRLRNISENIVSVYININKEKTNTVLGRENKLIYGKGEITDTLCGIAFRISPHSFYQINPYMTEKLYGRALDYAELTKADTVLDVYCGIGTISLAAAQRAGRVIGIEIVEQAVADACRNAENNGITNVQFYAQSAEEAVPQLIHAGLCPDVVILDPPRKGSDEKTLSAIVSAAPRKIIYVSCNPSTLARDAKFFAEHSYMPCRCTGVDMFSQTCHVETIVLMSRIEK